MSDAGSEAIAVPREEMVRVSRRVLDRPNADLLHWTIGRMPHASIIDTTGGLYVVSGISVGSGHEVQWSCVLKVLQPSEGADSQAPEAWCYWRREALFFGTGLGAALPPSLRAPGCFGVSAPSDDQVWLWLEHVAVGLVDPWNMDDFHRVAVASGRMAGSYVGGLGMPAEPWMAPSFLRSALAPGGFWSNFMDLSNPEGSWTSGLVAEAFDSSSRTRVLALWDQRVDFLDALDRIPQVFCHNDFHRRNLMLPRAVDEVPVAIDWAFCGPGALGADAAQLVLGTLYLTDVSVDEAQTLQDVVMNGYLQGLAECGWRGDQRLVRLGFAVWSALWMGATLPGWVALMLQDPEEGEVEAIYGRPAPEVLAQWVALDAFALDLADEARVLARAVD